MADAICPYQLQKSMLGVSFLEFKLFRLKSHAPYCTTAIMTT